jgi:glucose-6-phosphate dehydrogenase assembly protein OpcA
MLAERFRERTCSVPARYLTLVCPVDAGQEEAAIDRLNRTAGHPVSRTIVLSTATGRTTIDAVAEITCDVYPSPGEFGFLRETAILEVGDRHLPDIEAIVDPLLVADLPTVLWGPSDRPDMLAPLLSLADVVLLDSMDQLDVRAGLEWAREAHSRIGVVDLAWVRSSPWRRQAAASFDPPPVRAQLAAIDAVAIRHHPSATAAALLLAGWLGSRLGWSLRPLQTRAGGLAGVAATERGEVRIVLQKDRRQPVAGLALTIDTASRSLSFERGSGGLRVCDRESNGRARGWTSLGAWPDEGDVLEEGIRQTLLSDSLYGGALAAASVLAGAHRPIATSRARR